jgi:GNAT superfamily N-acetyltransferase
MIVREWDPGAASTVELAAVIDSLNAVIAVDLPEDPPWRPDKFGEYLAVTMPGERRVCWIAEEAAGDLDAGREPMGHANILLFGGIGVIEVMVHPRARRTGLGRDLLRLAVTRASDEGFASVGVEAVGGTPAIEFYEASGFRCAYMEMRSVLRLATVDWLTLGEMASGIGAGYQVEFYAGGLPEELIESYAEAKQIIRDDGDLELRPSSYDPERLRTSLTTLTDRGMKPYIVVATHERSGAVAGLTEVVAPAQHPTRADQYDTIVVPEHRGYGISRAIKARMLFELRSAEPGLHDVQTWNAPEQESIVKINAELGFRPDREWREYEADVADLVRRF